MNATNIKSTATPTKVQGSVAATPYSRLDINRVSP